MRIQSFLLRVERLDHRIARFLQLKAVRSMSIQSFLIEVSSKIDQTMEKEFESFVLS